MRSLLGRLIAAFLALGSLTFALPGAARADTALVVGACGGQTLVPGQTRVLSQGPSGLLCTNTTVVLASGSIQAGAAVVGAFVDGSIVTLGTKSDAHSCAPPDTVVACLGQIDDDVKGPIPSGTATIGDTLTGTTAFSLQTGASTNATSVAAGAHVLQDIVLTNDNTTEYFLRMYNLGTAPTCSSATGFVRTYAIPAAQAAGLTGGIVINLGPAGSAYSTGIAFCVTGGRTSTDNTNAATNIIVNLDYK